LTWRILLRPAAANTPRDHSGQPVSDMAPRTIPKGSRVWLNGGTLGAEYMAMRCIFNTGAGTCQVLRALGMATTREEREALEDLYCKTGLFTDCPLFRSMERGLARKQVRLRLVRRRVA